MVRNLILILVSMLLLSSCQREAQARTGIFLGGQIINPSSRAVTLYQGNLTIETLELDGEMRFQKK